LQSSYGYRRRSDNSTPRDSRVFIMTLRNYLPSITLLVILIFERLPKSFPDTIPPLMLESIGIFDFVLKVVLSSIIKTLPYGRSWGLEEGVLFFDIPTFFGWLVASLVIMVPAVLLNHLLVIRTRYFTPRTLLISLLLVLLSSLILFYWLWEVRPNPLSRYNL